MPRTGHPLTLHRFPDGVEGPHWYETRSPPHPPWVRTQEMHSFRSGKEVHAPVVDDLPSLVWAANAASIELHPYLGTADALLSPTVAVFDLDPGPPPTCSAPPASPSGCAPYSLRGLWYPTVSMPVTWDEVEAAVARDAVDPLVFLASDVERRIERMGDVFEPVRTTVQSLPA